MTFPIDDHANDQIQICVLRRYLCNVDWVLAGTLKMAHSHSSVWQEKTFYSLWSFFNYEQSAWPFRICGSRHNSKNRHTLIWLLVCASVSGIRAAIGGMRKLHPRTQEPGESKSFCRSFSYDRTIQGAMHLFRCLCQGNSCRGLKLFNSLKITEADRKTI